MDPLDWLFDASLEIGSKEILWREIVGNAFGLASALGGMRRRVWAWPVGIAGNVLLFTVFLGAVFDTPQTTTLWGQAGRQVFFVAVSVWGWLRWKQSRDSGGAGDGGAIAPRWAWSPTRERRSTRRFRCGGDPRSSVSKARVERSASILSPSWIGLSRARVSASRAKPSTGRL